MTFKEAEAAKKACEDATPIINGRRANCNLAALGARRPPRASSTTPQPYQRQVSNNSNTNVGGTTTAAAPTAAGHVQWYYPAAAGRASSPTTTTPFHPHQAVPFYGYNLINCNNCELEIYNLMYIVILKLFQVLSNLYCS